MLVIGDFNRLVYLTMDSTQLPDDWTARSAIAFVAAVCCDVELDIGHHYIRVQIRCIEYTTLNRFDVGFRPVYRDKSGGYF